MALYKYDQYLQQTNDNAFDALHGPAQNTPHSGIYRCEGCAKEIASGGGASHHEGARVAQR
jgi:hypothetical protein